MNNVCLHRTLPRPVGRAAPSPSHLRITVRSQCVRDAQLTRYPTSGVFFLIIHTFRHLYRLIKVLIDELSRNRTRCHIRTIRHPCVNFVRAFRLTFMVHVFTFKKLLTFDILSLWLFTRCKYSFNSEKLSICSFFLKKGWINNEKTSFSNSHYISFIFLFFKYTSFSRQISSTLRTNLN